ncbi:hypothetical protein PC120_g24025 [Phytophthora cactorum]|nr:hypothetical protein PC120_g24025 [Phytophthora cactorum]
MLRSGSPVSRWQSLVGGGRGNGGRGVYGIVGRLGRATVHGCESACLRLCGGGLCGVAGVECYRRVFDYECDGCYLCRCSPVASGTVFYDKRNVAYKVGARSPLMILWWRRDVDVFVKLYRVVLVNEMALVALSMAVSLLSKSWLGV